MNFFECSTAETEIQKIYFLFKNYKMKTLLKISLVFVFALFISMSLKAQNPTPVAGTITTNVASYLNFGTLQPDVSLNYNEATNQYTSANTVINVKASVDWALTLIALDAMFNKANTAENFPVGQVAVTGDLKGTLSSTIPISVDGSKTQQKNATFTLSGLGNLYAGDYTARIQYALTQK
jgi:hypothetical protein